MPRSQKPQIRLEPRMKEQPADRTVRQIDERVEQTADRTVRQTDEEFEPQGLVDYDVSPTEDEDAVTADETLDKPKSVAEAGGETSRT